MGGDVVEGEKATTKSEGERVRAAHTRETLGLASAHALDTSSTSHRAAYGESNSLGVGNSNTVSNVTVLAVGPTKNVDYESSKDVNNK